MIHYLLKVFLILQRHFTKKVLNAVHAKTPNVYVSVVFVGMLSKIVVTGTS